MLNESAPEPVLVVDFQDLRDPDLIHECNEYVTACGEGAHNGSYHEIDPGFWEDGKYPLLTEYYNRFAGSMRLYLHYWW